MTKMFENFIEQRENPAKEATTAQSECVCVCVCVPGDEARPIHLLLGNSNCVTSQGYSSHQSTNGVYFITGHFEQQLSVLQPRCKEIEM